MTYTLFHTEIISRKQSNHEINNGIFQIKGPSENMINSFRSLLRIENKL